MHRKAASPHRILVVADWSVDPHAVVATCVASGDAASFVVTVPAWLHGLDWAGDPAASAPCAQRQQQTIVGLARAAGLALEDAGIGDPDPITAIGDAVDAHGVAEVILFTRRRRLTASHPWDLEHRAQRLTGLPVHQLAVPAAETGHCHDDARLAA
jgi:hypothetical protein